MNGPMKQSQEQRRELCMELMDRLKRKFADRVRAIGVYGSVSRGTDGPYSDVEILCVLRSATGAEPIDYPYEWSAGPWKAEVNVLSEDVLLKEAATVEGTWPLTHGQFVSVWSLYDPQNFFTELQTAVQSTSAEEFKQAISDTLVGEMYEFIGKLRNIAIQGPRSYLPYLVMQLAHYGAMILGLHHRKLYTTGSKVIPESLVLPQRPEGYDKIAELVLSGQLSDFERLIVVSEHFWSGLVKWADIHGYAMDAAERIPF